MNNNCVFLNSFIFLLIINCILLMIMVPITLRNYDYEKDKKNTFINLEWETIGLLDNINEKYDLTTWNFTCPFTFQKKQCNIFHNKLIEDNSTERILYVNKECNRCYFRNYSIKYTDSSYRKILLEITIINSIIVVLLICNISIQS